MENFMTFIQLQWGNIAMLLGLLLSAGLIIAKWTKTPEDDKWFARLLDWLNMLPKTAKKTLQDKKKDE